MWFLISWLGEETGGRGKEGRRGEELKNLFLCLLM
jgi:hypothetical protein